MLYQATNIDNTRLNQRLRTAVALSQCTKPLFPKKSVSISLLLIPRSVSVYYFSANNDDEEEEPTFRERFVAYAIKIIDMFCVWDCCKCWVFIQKYVALLVFDPFVELFITLCIVVNTLFMALDHHDMDKDLERALKSGNYVTYLPISKTLPKITFL